MGNSVYGVNPQIDPARASYGDAPSSSLIYDRSGNRKYLTANERRLFLDAVDEMPPELRTFCRVLSYTGARISEVLAMTPSRFDTVARLVIVESLKKRQRGVFRAIPLPLSVLNELDRVHHLSDSHRYPEPTTRRLWPWCRAFAWRRIKETMAIAGVDGPQATPKGLRHSFAITALQGGVPITMIKRWLGHSRLSTTEIYADAVGPEEQLIARGLWKTF